MQLFMSLTLATLLSLAPPPAVVESSTTSFIYAACSPSPHPPAASFQSSLHSLLASIANSAAHSPFQTFSTGNNTAFGLYQCRGDEDCSSCVRSAVAQVGLVCPGAGAASLQLDGCLVRYSDEDFFGRLDVAEEYRRCGGEEGGGGGREFLRRREEVLEELGRGRRVGSSGEVEGEAECEGDLAAGDCESCLGRAVERLREVCEAAMAAELFLRGCYVRVWASGYYPRAAVAAGLLLFWTARNYFVRSLELCLFKYLIDNCIKSIVYKM